MERIERRRSKRIAAKYDLTCRKIGSAAAESLHAGQTADVSPGGLFFKTATDNFKSGNLLRIELSIPPTSGELEFGGRISALGKVVRIYDINSHHEQKNRHCERYGVAMEFCRFPRLSS